MTNIVICTLICATVIFCVVYTIHKGIPPVIIEHREMTWVPNEPEANPIGFTDSTEKPATEEKTLTDKEEMENVLKDVASTITALCRGEVDISELN